MSTKQSQPKSWELWFILWKFLGLQTWEIASQEPWESCSKEASRGVRLYRSLQQGADSLNIKRLLLIKENQVSQVKGSSIFIFMGRCKSLGSPRSFFPEHLSYLGPVICVLFVCLFVLFLFCFVLFCFVCILSSSVFTIGSGCSLVAARMHRYCSPFWLFLGLRNSHFEGQNCWWLWYFCYLHGRKCSISHR